MAVKKTPSWMKKGSAAKAVMDQEEAKVKMAVEEASRMRRYYMPAGISNQITFLDGELNDKNILDCLVYLEHQVFMNGKWTNFFTCVHDEEPCPICAAGHEAKSVAVLTVIDHNEWVSEKTGKVYKDQRKLFVMKRGTYKMLMAKAKKYGGSLTGVTFDVTRTGDKDASVGNDFDYVETRTLEDLTKAYPHTFKQQKESDVYKKFKTIVPADYEEEIVYRDAAELAQHGFSDMSAITDDTASEGSTTDYDDEV